MSPHLVPPTRLLIAATLLVTGCASPHSPTPSAPAPASEGPGLVPAECREAVTTALAAAGPNASELADAIRLAPAEQRSAVCFLIANMPDVDLQSLAGAFILENVAWAYKAREAMPWGKDIPDELFLNDVLPYANVNERRDDWRRDFYQRFSLLVRDCRTPAEAAQKLNREIFPLLQVQYHATKRPKPDQSPYESTEAHYASCTGLSVLLADACRAVCIPARLAGTPAWTTKDGNHSWVEVWDRQWYFAGSAEPDPAGLNRAWFVDDAAKADPGHPLHRIYAVSFRKTGQSFPLVWNPELKWVNARDVTSYYTNRKKVHIRVLDGPNGRPLAGRLVLRQQGELYAASTLPSPATDPANPPAPMGSAGSNPLPPTDDTAATFELPGSEDYELEFTAAGGHPTRSTIRTTDESDQTITIEAPR